MSVTVSSPSRLHFGLLSVGERVERAYGGIGVMIQAPRTTVTASAAEQFAIVDHSCDASISDRCPAGAKIVERWLTYVNDLLPENARGGRDQLPVRLTIDDACPRHNGLGSGTQLALTLALALQNYFQIPVSKPDELAISLGRAGRSAIGTWGCFEGGFLVDRGKTPHELVAPIDLRLDFPDDWPIALVFSEPSASSGLSSDQAVAGLHGEDEIAAFASLPPTTKQELTEMRAIVKEKIVPAVVNRDYDDFAKALQTFGRRSGDYFKPIQGGTFASPQITQIINLIAANGVLAVGQTSWGPCVFAIGKDMAQLKDATDQVIDRYGDWCRIEFTHADNIGTRVSHD